MREVFGAEPDKWQADALRAFGDPAIQRISLQAAVGPGKSTVLAWCGWNFLSCYGEVGEHPKGAAVSTTGDNLKDNLWPEFAKWQGRSPFLMAAFQWSKERIFAKDHPETWFISARRWNKEAIAEEQGRTLSGLHSKYVLALIDESGDIPVSVLKSAEQALSNCTFGKILQAGNPITQDGMLYAAATKLRAQWHVIQVTGDPDDPKRSPRIPLDWAAAQIAEFGRSDPWVMAYILGQYPPSSFNSLLSVRQVEDAMARNPKITDYDFAAKVIGVDVAREGDDRSCIFARQGLLAHPPTVLRSADSIQGGGHVAVRWREWGADACFVDDTGGFGAGWIDQLRVLGYHPTGIHFSAEATDPRFANKRSEMWWKMAEWVKAGGALPDVPELVGELTVPTYFFKRDRLQIEDKEQIKKRLGRSPDLADALCLTWAFDVVPAGDFTGLAAQSGMALMDYDPYK